MLTLSEPCLRASQPCLRDQGGRAGQVVDAGTREEARNLGVGHVLAAHSYPDVGLGGPGRPDDVRNQCPDACQVEASEGRAVEHAQSSIRREYLVLRVVTGETPHEGREVAGADRDDSTCSTSVDVSSAARGVSIISPNGNVACS